MTKDDVHWATLVAGMPKAIVKIKGQHIFTSDKWPLKWCALSV